MADPFRPTVSVSPRYEIFYALAALFGTDGGAIGRWRDATVTELPAGFTEKAKAVAPVRILWPLYADALQHEQGLRGLPDVLRAVSDLDPGELQRNILSGVFHDRRHVHALLSGAKSVSEAPPPNPASAGLLKYLGLDPFRKESPAVRVFSELIEKPRKFRDALSSILREFSSEAFAKAWDAMVPEMRRSAERVTGSAHATFRRFTEEAGLPVTFDSAGSALTVRGSKIPIPLSKVESLTVLPSAFNTAGWWARYESEGGKSRMFFPLYEADLIERTIAAVEAPRKRKPVLAGAVNSEAVLNALGDRTRFAIASVLATNPKSAADLSRMFHVSKPTITHHIHALRNAGLIGGPAAGESGLLTINRDVLENLSESLVTRLFTPGVKPALSRTRRS